MSIDFNAVATCPTCHNDLHLCVCEDGPQHEDWMHFPCPECGEANHICQGHEEPEPIVTRTWRYGSYNRPVSFSTVPQENMVPDVVEGHPDFPHGCVEYTQPLTVERAQHFSLVLIPEQGDIDELIGAIVDHVTNYIGDDYRDLIEGDPRWFRSCVVGHAIDKRNIYLKAEVIAPLVLVVAKLKEKGVL